MKKVGTVLTAVLMAWTTLSSAEANSPKKATRKINFAEYLKKTADEQAAEDKAGQQRISQMESLLSKSPSVHKSRCGRLMGQILSLYDADKDGTLNNVEIQSVKNDHRLIMNKSKEEYRSELLTILSRLPKQARDISQRKSKAGHSKKSVESSAGQSPTDQQRPSGAKEASDD